MGAGRGGTKGRGPATRQWIAAALVLAAVPAGVVAGLLAASSPEIAVWVLAGSALSAALVLLAGSPAGGAAAPLWRLLGLGVGLCGGAFAAIATTYDDIGDLPIPSAADAPWVGGSLIIGVAVVLMAVARTFRDDNIARIDAAIFGIGAGVVLVAFVWPELRDADLPRGGLALGIAIGVVAAFLVGSSARLAVTGASRLAAGRFTIEAVLGITAGWILLRTTQFSITDSGAGQVGFGLSVAGCWVLAAGAVHPSASRITEREQRRAHDLGHLRLGLLTLATASGPICAMVQQLRGEPVDGLQLGVR
jgi:hypothetical protein